VPHCEVLFLYCFGVCIGNGLNIDEMFKSAVWFHLFLGRFAPLFPVRAINATLLATFQELHDDFRSETALFQSKIAI
jgi:hypothetical protein